VLPCGGPSAPGEGGHALPQREVDSLDKGRVQPAVYDFLCSCCTKTIHDQLSRDFITHDDFSLALGR
jgi:hypothetical protein